MFGLRVFESVCIREKERVRRRYAYLVVDRALRSHSINATLRSSRPSPLRP